MHAGRTSALVALGALSAVVIATACFSLSAAPRDAVPAWLALVAASAFVLAIAGVALVRAAPKKLALWILGGAIALRAAALLAPVSLSDDVYRYAWDGSLVIDGVDPFAHRPSELPDTNDVPRASLNSPDYYSVYPPLAQALFALAALIARLASIDPTLALRLLFVIAELAAIALLLRLAKPRPELVLLYAWSPLAYWEVAAGAHTEALMLPFLALAVVSAIDRRPARAGLFLGLAASAKLTALVLLPILFVYLWRTEKKRAFLALTSLAVLGAGFLPFASPHLLDHVAESLALYQETFSFNAPIYYGAQFLFGYREGWNEPSDLVMPLLAVLTLAWIAFQSHRQDGSPTRLVRGLAFTYLGYLLLSRVVHPWYLLPPLALGALAGDRAMALFGVLTLASYLRYHLGFESPMILLLPFTALLVYEPAAQQKTHYAQA